ncbi:MAG TPA: hypothetical protein VJA28_00940 [Patescibacteria group bacterium]|nr:hypothetical protein [Patescibacteria group bacterium]
MWRLFLFWQRETWRAFWRRPPVLTPAIMTVVLVALSWFMAARVLPSEVAIMRYSIYVGTNWLVPAGWIFILPAIATLVAVFDFSLAYGATRASLILRYLWLWAAVFVAAGTSWLGWLLLRINS